MNFVTFPVSTTNIFPASNTTKGGQLVTEFNLRSRESIGTPEDVSYMIGPSYVHSEEDFSVSIQTDGAGTVVSSSVLVISEGRGVINGHFVENLAPMMIDMLDANAQAQLAGSEPLKGALSIGLRIMYSTIPTMVGSILVENNRDMFEGVQVVILPRDQFLLPIDVPDEPDKVTAHLKLADFNFVNGSINNVVNNYPDKCKYISADRIANVDLLLSDAYIKKTGLNPKKLYTFAGKGTDPATGLDTWCDSTDSLIVWDNNPQLTTTVPSSDNAQFLVATSGAVQLYMPHKQVDGMTTTDGTPQYYASRSMDLPVADYMRNTSGTVDSTYTQHIKDIAEQLNNIYRMPAGKQVGYIDVLSDRGELPPINPAWDDGDYIVVSQDNTLDVLNDTSRAPSTMYVVIPGIVSDVTYVSSTTSTTIPESLTGIQLGVVSWSNEEAPNTTDPSVYREYFGLSSNYRGVVGKDYFVVQHVVGDVITSYYYSVSASGERSYSDSVMLTGQIPFAQETVIGGFLNVPDTALDSGYVYRDENGHLRLLDYTLLRTGTLAYQLGQDYSSPAGLTTSDLQSDLDEYVNQRVAFPNASHMQTADNPNVINITINLSAEDSGSTLNIYDIDSRFGTSIYIHILGEATNTTVINISDCEKVRIDNNIEGSPVINLYRCGLYYDADIIDRLNTIQDMTLWYEQFEESDPKLVVDDMTVREMDGPIMPDDLDFWSTTAPNDNHYMYALQSLTFGSDGTIIGIGLYVKNDTAANVTEGTSIMAASFELPQGAGLYYPKSKMTKQLKITGSFVTAYPITNPTGQMVINTSFTALTQAYNQYDVSNVLKGTISFLTTAQHVTSIIGVGAGVTIDGWESNSFHIFHGGVIA